VPHLSCPNSNKETKKRKEGKKKKKKTKYSNLIITMNDPGATN
jgi:hypothetical protein